jgi:hypothetical protein
VSGNPPPRLAAVLSYHLQMVAKARSEMRDGLVRAGRQRPLPDETAATAQPAPFLSPELIKAILQGRQPVELTATRLTELDLPLDWTDQHSLLTS